MAKMTKAQREWRPGQKKKPRSTRALFASTVLSLEALLAIFIALAVFGLKRDSIPPVLVLSVGVALAIACLLTCGLLRKPLGYQIGWGIQIVFILTGFLMPSMFILGAAFTATWWYAVTKGRTMDLETARRAKEQEAWEAAHPEPEES
ncbi:hypothetical protein CQ018_08035 [Arthrobacter sp. MYb227]|uniref:DUF4233 domain-containing protein n=1 Tax=Arthrobacter sp. MYb227 TaxID=1848601 RepID=UPI000CFD2E76|nr:DUF4233 domain-containing protein [Arthrobacter sp. MYb227]PQZ93606.1 hypothetical protein CQ018_08035 [Arthrobacter sp. MYb227]